MRMTSGAWVRTVAAMCMAFLGSGIRAADDLITVYVPPFEGPHALATSVATIINLQIWQTLRMAPNPNPQNLSFGDGRIRWGRPLGRYSHESAEARAKEASLLAQVVLWGKVYEFGDGAIAQANLSIPAYYDFRASHPEIWTLRIQSKAGAVELEADVPQRRYSFEPIVLSGDVIRAYSKPGALLMYRTKSSQEEIGAVGNQFKLIENGPHLVKVRSGKLEGWVRLPTLSDNRSEVVDFVGGVVRAFRGDWEGVSLLMVPVVENSQAPNELRTDAYLYKGMAEARRNLISEASFTEARRLSPNARRCIVYSVMGKLSGYNQMQATGVAVGLRVRALQEARALLNENGSLFESADPWVTQAAVGIDKLIEAETPP